MDIALYLKKRGLTVVEAAKQIGMDRSVLQRIKTGSRPASRDAITKIVRWSGGAVTYADFFESDAPGSGNSGDVAA